MMKHGWPNFFKPVNPGWFLMGMIERESREHPRSSIRVVSQKYGSICGYVPHEWDGTKVVRETDDQAIDKRVCNYDLR